VTADARAHVRFRRAIERRTLWMAEDAARELPNLPLEDTLQLVYLYAKRGSPKFERAAGRWLVRYMTEGLLLSSLCFASPSHDHMPARIHDSRGDGPLSAAPPQRLPAVRNLLPVGDFPCTVGVAHRHER
jgi:hypothetical protein